MEIRCDFSAHNNLRKMCSRIFSSFRFLPSRLIFFFFNVLSLTSWTMAFMQAETSRKPALSQQLHGERQRRPTHTTSREASGPSCLQALRSRSRHCTSSCSCFPDRRAGISASQGFSIREDAACGNSSPTDSERGASSH